MIRCLCAALLLGLAVFALAGCASSGTGANNLGDCNHPYSTCYNYDIG